MKIKLLTLLAVVFLLSNISLAQGIRSYTSTKTVTTKRKLTEKEIGDRKQQMIATKRHGIFLTPELNMGISGLNFNFDVGCVFGYEFNNYFALGIGFGYKMAQINESYISDYVHYANSGSSYYRDADNKSTTGCIPLFINIHGDLIKTKVSPYWRVDFGYCLPIKKAIANAHYWGDADYRYQYYGLYISPELGVRAGMCYIGWSLQTLTSYEKKIWHGDLLDSHEQKVKIFSILKFGYKIHFKND